MSFFNDFKNLINNDKNNYTLEELLNHFGTASIIIILIIATIITSIPLPPWGWGFESVPGGILCIFVALQGLLGFKTLYLPETIKKIKFNIKIVKDSSYTKKILILIEKYVKPNRYSWAFNRLTKIIMFLLIIPNALLMILPIIFTNGPPSQCISLMSLAWLLSDGFYFLLMLGISGIVILIYIILFIIFKNIIYNKQKWIFGSSHSSKII
jgi:hypothetical protein